MKLLCATDIHGEWAVFERILKNGGTVDAVLLGGDITNFGTPDGAERLVRQAQQHCPTVLAVAGNCDSAAIDDRLTHLGVSLFRAGVVLHGFGFYGVSAMPPWCGMYELTEDEIAEALELGRAQAAAPGREIVLSHTPPHATALDLTYRNQHVGSTAVREFIDKAEPMLVLCGHIHEARGQEQIGATTVVNCGVAARGQYALVDLSKTVQVELRSA